MTTGKRLLDLAIALPLGIALVPLVGIVSLLNRFAGDPGSVLYRAVRVGEHGRPFRVIKLRTMRDGLGGGPLTAHGDPRVTKVGRFLRRSKVDELPQLWNVIRGEMTLVGPRPEDAQFVDWADPVHQVVFSARPGITGLAQLVFVDEESLHRDVDPARRYRSEILPGKLELDHRYLLTRSMRLDARILLDTATVVGSRITRRARRR